MPAPSISSSAFGIGDGDEVVTSPFSFIASSNGILYEQANQTTTGEGGMVVTGDPEIACPRHSRTSYLRKDR